MQRTEHTCVEDSRQTQRPSQRDAAFDAPNRPCAHHYALKHVGSAIFTRCPRGAVYTGALKALAAAQDAEEVTRREESEEKEDDETKTS